MAKAKRARAAKKATPATETPIKTVRRKNDRGEVEEIEVPDIPVEKAKIKIDVDTVDSALERRKLATDHLEKITGKSLADRRTKAIIGEAIRAIDKKIASLR